MDSKAIDELLRELASQLGERDMQREPVRVWGMSGVERVCLPDGRRVIFKYAREPFRDEARILHHVAAHGLPVPELLASTTRGGVLGMLMEDLGPSREPTLNDAAEAAVAVHRLPLPPQRVPVLDSVALAELPARARDHLSALRAAGRWADATDTDADLQRLARSAERRARDAEIPPFGLVHSEFHPTSLHIGSHGWRLLDFARACVGPGVLDLVSWQGTTSPPDPAALWDLLHAYVRAGGADSVLADRGGLDVVSWAIGFHRLWIVEWYLELARWWMPEPDYDEHDAAVVRRHLAEVTQCLS